MILGSALTLTLAAASGARSIDSASCPDLFSVLTDATITGSQSDDTLLGTPQRDVIDGLGGNDTIDGRGGHDLICGGNGNDRLLGGAGGDVLVGEGGNDVLDGGDQPQYYYDFAAYDEAPNAVTVDLAAGNATGIGLDRLVNLEAISGSRFADTLTGSPADDFIRGQSGRDRLKGLSGDDFLGGGEGDDLEIGGGGEDTADYGDLLSVTVNLAMHVATSTIGRDRLQGIEDVDGSEYPDRIVGDASANYLRGFGRDDVIIGGGGPDVLEGNQGNDRLDGGAGRDRGLGGAGRDSCRRIERKSTCERR